MHIFEIESIEYELEFAPNLFRTQEQDNSQRALVRHNRQPKKKHHRPQHPSTHLTRWGYFYNTNSSDPHQYTHCLNAGHPCTYVPMLMLTQCGLLICLFVTVYSLCVAGKSKARREPKICTTAV